VIVVVAWLGIAKGKFYSWKERYGHVNEHNANVPRDHWIEAWERDAIIEFHGRYPLEGYRRLTFMMLDQTEVAVSPSTTYRVLRNAHLLDRWNPKPSKKGTGFVQPLAPHKHWHIDIAYLNIAGTFYFLCSLLDGFSRFIVHWEIRETMKEGEVETIIQRGRERHPGVTPRIISDNGPQFLAKDFKEFIRVCGMTHVKTSPYYPQSNGKIERFHRTIKGDCIRPRTPLSLEEARRQVGAYVERYNTVRLHSAIGYLAPKDKLQGRAEEIFAARDRKLAEARQRRKTMRQTKREEQSDMPMSQHARPSIDFAALRASITLAEVLDLLGFVATASNGAQQRGPCPIHRSQSPGSRSFSANLADNVFQCFKCGGHGNALELWAAAKGLPIYDAAVDLCQQLSRPVPIHPANREEEPVVILAIAATT